MPFLLKELKINQFLATFLYKNCLYIKLLKMDSKLINKYSMEILTQPNYQTNLESDVFFDKRSRENYFAMLEVALKNLSLVDHKVGIN